MSTDKKANASGRTGPIAHDLGKIRVGRLPTINQDEYPGLSGWWVQLRIGEDGEEVLARVYGNTPEQAHSRATALAGQPSQALTQQTLDDVMAGIPARDAEIAALRKEIEALQAAQAQTRPTVTAGMVMEAEAVLIRAGGTFHRQVKDAIEAALDVAQQDGQFTVQAQQPVSGADRLPIELRGISEAIGNGGGFWRSCSGCHESNEGMATGPFSETLKCHLGVGCSECGGIGAIWDTTDYDAMGDFMATEYQQRTVNTEPVDQDQLRDAMQIIEPSGNTGELPELPDIAPTDDWDSVLDCIKKYGVACYQAALQNQPQNIPEIIPESAKLDADKVQADLLNSLVEIVDAVIASDEEGLIEHSETIIKARAAIDAARKEPDQ